MRIQQPSQRGSAGRAGVLVAALLASPAHPGTAATFRVRVDDGRRRQDVAVVEGRYRVAVLLRGPAGETASLLAEQRRLMAESIALQGATAVERTIVVDVRRPDLGPLPEHATGGTRVQLKLREEGSRSWDDRMTLEVTGNASLVSIAVTPVDVPTLYLAGDSTVTDQPVAPNASWGQMLPRFFAPDIAVANHAESGETLKSFVTERRLDKLLSRLKLGDWVMIQFAHNDQKAQWPQTYADAATTYRSWLRTYIAEIRRLGATPILVTSPDRRNFDAAGKITSTLGDYPGAMRIVAQEERVALIGLDAMSRQFYEALGPAAAPRAFADEGRDLTHFNEYGAYQLARCVVEGIRAADPQLIAGLARHLTPDAGRFDPHHPDAQPP